MPKPVRPPSAGNVAGPAPVGKAVAPPSGGTKTKKKGGSSVGGFLGNTVGDIKEITVGAVPAAVATGKAAWDLLGMAGGSGTDSTEETKRLAKGVAKQYQQNYGSWKGFKSALYNDPVFVVMDALTVASLGTTGAARVGLIPLKAGKTATITSRSGVTAEKALARSELRAQVQSALTKVGDPDKKIAKLERTNLARKDVNTRAANQGLDVALKKVKRQPEKVATFLLGRYDRPALNAYVKTLRESDLESAQFMADLIESPKVQRLFDNPTPRMVKVLEEARPVAAKQAELLRLAPDTVANAPFRPARVAEGARWDPETQTLIGGPTVEELKARGLNPIYFPDTPKLETGHGAGAHGGGVSVPNKTANMRQNRGVLQLTGQLIADPAVLNQSFLKAAKYAHYNDIHDTLLSLAVPVNDIRPGMVYIRKKRSDRIKALDKTRPDWEAWAAQYLDDNGDMKFRDPLGSNEDSLVTRSPEEAVTDAEGRYQAVPEAVARTLAGEFVYQSKFVYMMNKYPMRVWRALVLGLRPAYLVNNAIGNTFMYLVHSGRPEDFRQLAGAFRDFVKKKDRGAFDRLAEQHFAGQIRGGFVATQMPELKPTNRVLKAADATVSFIPKLDRRWEQALRSAKLRAELKRHPGLREKAHKMGTETNYFERVQKILDDGDPVAATQVYDRVNDALGNYDHMTGFERGALRTLFPFYAWYRAILGVTGKLAIEQPLKVALIGRLGQIAIEDSLEESGWSRDQIPTSLLGFLPIRKDNGRVRGFNTAPFNPASTVAQIVEFAAAIASLKAGKAGRLIPGGNPLILEFLNYVYGQNPAGYGVPDIPGVGVLDALPQSRLLGSAEAQFGFDIPGVKTAPQGNTLNDRDFWDELLRQFGAPYARVSPSAAKRVASG